jgi:hypothetical protein
MSLAHGGDWLAVLAQAKRILASEFGIRHATLQPTWPVAAAVRDDRRVIAVVPVDDHDDDDHAHGTPHVH